MSVINILLHTVDIYFHFFSFFRQEIEEDSYNVEKKEEKTRKLACSKVSYYFQQNYQNYYLRISSLHLLPRRCQQNTKKEVFIIINSQIGKPTTVFSVKNCPTTFLKCKNCAIGGRDVISENNCHFQCCFYDYFLVKSTTT